MTGYIRLEKPPEFSISYPTCSICDVDLEHDDGWTCPVCGTTWSSNASDGDEGELYESWSGESLEDTPVSTEAEASAAGSAHVIAERKATFARFGWCEHGASGNCWMPGCAGGKKIDKIPKPPAGYDGCRVFTPGSLTSHLVKLDDEGRNGGRPTVCGLTRFDDRDEDGKPIPNTADLPGWGMGMSGVEGPGVEQIKCPGCWPAEEANPD